MKKLIIANWKMHVSLSDAYKILAQLVKPFYNDLIISPPIPYLADLQKNFPEISFCSQDVSVYHRFGAYSGEYSADIIKGCGVNYALIGHSERRLIGRDTNKQVQQKILNCIKSEVSPVLCVGEPIESRQSKNYPEFIMEQINSALPPEDFLTNHPLPKSGIIIAYEPLWAIGAGFTPKITEINEIIELIKSAPLIKNLASRVKIVYGGSVSASNYRELIAVEGLDGLIVGNSSLKPAEITAMLSQNAIVNKATN